MNTKENQKNELKKNNETHTQTHKKITLDLKERNQTKSYGKKK
jgi:hypothetical protein